MPVNSDVMKTITTMKICHDDADRGVAGEADEVADQHVVDDALQAADDVGQHGGPGDLPDRGPQRAFDDGAVVAPRRGRRGGGE